MELSNHERGVLAKFAEQKRPMSRYELFGEIDCSVTIRKLCAEKLLKQIPSEKGTDRFGGTLFEATTKGRLLISGKGEGAEPASKKIPTAGKKAKAK